MIFLERSLLFALIAILFTQCARQPIYYAPNEFDPVENQGLSIQFLGNTNILFDDGETKILTDGFFSRPSATKLIFGKIKPNEKRVKYALAKAKINGLDAVIPLHSHYDHAMDAPVVAKLTGANLIGSSSTLNIGKGLGLDPNQMFLADTSVIELGNFKLQLIESEHLHYNKEKLCEKLLDKHIEKPLIPPVKFDAYVEGKTYTLIIKHKDISIGVQGSTGYKKGALEGHKVDVLFTSIGGVSAKNLSANDQYQRHVIDNLEPNLLIPIHWDSMTRPLKRGLRYPSFLFQLVSSSHSKKTIAMLKNTNKNRRTLFLPLWKRIDVKTLLQAEK
jgi:L-ascorbate metabolism protein UlaG (beta-lactamase superfamily)